MPAGSKQNFIETSLEIGANRTSTITNKKTHKYPSPTLQLQLNTNPPPASESFPNPHLHPRSTSLSSRCLIPTHQHHQYLQYPQHIHTCTISPSVHLQNHIQTHQRPRSRNQPIKPGLSTAFPLPPRPIHFDLHLKKKDQPRQAETSLAKVMTPTVR